MNSTICAVITSYNAPRKLSSCINSVINQTDKIIVVDNSDNLAIKQLIRDSQYPEKVSFIFSESNKGLGFALNEGIKYSVRNKYCWTLLLDQDSILSSSMVQELLHSHDNLDVKSQHETALIVPSIYDINSHKEFPSIITTRFLHRRIRNPGKDMFIHFHMTSGTLLKNALIEGIGLMNDKFFIDYIDYDYCFRVVTLNYKILLSKNAVLSHSLSSAKKKSVFCYREHEPLRLYYQTRNRLFTLSKFGKCFRSFSYEESIRLILKIFKIIFLESRKKEKLKMIFKGIREFLGNPVCP